MHDRVPEQTRLRMGVRQSLLDAGVDPYPPSFRPTRGDRRAAAGHDRASIAGRVMAVRDLGGVIFVRLRDWSGDTQLMLSTGRASAATRWTGFRHVVDLGDHVGAEGTMVLSRSGELSLEVDQLAADLQVAAAAARQAPRHHRPRDQGPAALPRPGGQPGGRRQLAARSRIIRAVRDTLDGLGFLEVETPILQTIHGGANARPFRTHINAYDLELYLRIAPELYLKRLMVGGVDRIFEIGRNFRNEGADATHNPEFTMLEAYQAYGDYTTMRTVAQQLIVNAARAATGGTVISRHRPPRRRAPGRPGRAVAGDHGQRRHLAAAAGTTVTADTGLRRARRAGPVGGHRGRPALDPRRGAAGALRAPGRAPRPSGRPSTPTSPPRCRR